MAFPEMTHLGYERRTSPRKKLYLGADLTLPGNRTVVSHTVDISADGAMVKVPCRLDAGAHCAVKFRCERAGALRGFELLGVVRYCVLRGEHFYVGLQFENLESPAKEALQSLL